jgi:hypothetical protein
MIAEHRGARSPVFVFLGMRRSLIMRECGHPVRMIVWASSIVIPEAERSEAVRNPVTTARGYWIPGSPLRGAPE